MIPQNKECTRCGLPRAMRLFGWLKKHHRGRAEIHRDSWCLLCRRDYKKQPTQRAKTLRRLKLRRLTDEKWRQEQNKKGREYYQKNREKVLAKGKLYIAKKGNGDLNLGYLDSRLRAKFGISLSDYHALAKAQNYRCASCGRDERTSRRRLAVDHDHITRKIRGLLCHHCNTGLGNFKDSPALLMKAIEYLSKHARWENVS